MASAEPDDSAGTLTSFLRALGWSKRIDGIPHGDRPVDGRSSWVEEVIESRFRNQVRAINLDPDGSPWLDDERVDHIRNALLRSNQPGLVEANQHVTELLLRGIPVKGLPDWDGGRAQVVRLVDWDRPENNDLLLVTDFRLDRPYDGGAPFVVFDAVLFVNGVPLALVEGVRPDREPTVAEAIDDLRAYTGQRPEGMRESVPSFFRFVQVLVATNGTEARIGTITSDPEHYAYWRTVEPASPEQVRAELGYDRHASLTELETVAAGALRPSHLLDLVRNFSVFHQVEGRTLKIVARYQQFRAVHGMISRLIGRAPGPAGHKRGGVIWHTQGSGKSFTMAFLVRKMRTIAELADFKVVVVVDRVNLREQLQPSLALAGETPVVAGGEADARAKLADDVPGIVTIMIQHAQRDDEPGEPSEDGLVDDPSGSVVAFPVLNSSSRIVVVADEAHRSQRGRLHARLRHALPNAAWIGFTGTPLLRADKESHTTENTFGPFIDQYRLGDSEADGATVPIRYEQRRAEAYIVDRVILDAAYEVEVGGTPRQRQEAQQRLVNTRRAMESSSLIEPKARDMLRQWVETVLPNALKAQVVAVSRLAAVRYRDALLAARDELVRQLEEFDPDTNEPDPDAELLKTAFPYLPLLRVIDFIPVISAGTRKDEEGRPRKDPPEWRQWTDENRQREHIDRFKRRMPAPEGLTPDGARAADDAPWTEHPARTGGSHPVHSGDEYDPWHETTTPDDNFHRAADPSIEPWQQPEGGPGAEPAPIAFIIVNNMLLTGFDAPIEQVLYLDRAIRDANLLQAIARTNRPARHKDVGLVVDYAGVSRYLDDALSAYDETDLDGYREFLVDVEVPRLRDRHELVRQFLADHGVDGIAELSDASVRANLVALLADPQLRTDFDALVGDFLTTLDAVLPRPQALEYEADAAQLGITQYLLRRIYRDTRSGGLDPYRYGAKVRRLLDRHIKVSGITQRIPPVEISDPDFVNRIDQVEDARVRALHMEHALRRHISQRQPGDPAFYERLSERLERVLQQLRDDAEARAHALEELIQHEREAESHDFGLDPRTEGPVYRLLLHRLSELDGTAPAHTGSIDFRTLTHDIVAMVREDTGPPHFPQSNHLQDRLRKRLVRHLMRHAPCDRDIATPLAEEIVGVARARWHDFQR